MLFLLVKEGLKNKNLESSYSLAQEQLEKLCFIAVDPRIQAYVTSKRLHMIDFSSWILPLNVVKKDKLRKNLPSNQFPCSWQAQW